MATETADELIAESIKESDADEDGLYVYTATAYATHELMSELEQQADSVTLTGSGEGIYKGKTREGTPWCVMLTEDDDHDARCDAERGC